MTTDEITPHPSASYPVEDEAAPSQLEDGTALSATTSSSQNVFRSRKLVPRPKKSQPQPTTPPPPPRQDTLRGLMFGACMSIFAGTAAFMIVASVVLAIIVPPWYRSLEPRYQAIWCNRVDALCDLTEERETDDVYALSSDQAEAAAAAAQALLVETATPTPSPAPTIAPSTTPTPTSSSKGSASVMTSTPSAVPSNTPTATLTPSATPTQTPIPLPQLASLQLDSLTWEQQRWNNCGPTTLTMGLSYFGYTNNQTRAAQFLKPDPEDTNVSPGQMVDFVNQDVSRELGVKALYRVGGTPELLKRLVLFDFPVIVERGIVLEEEGWMGHYSLIVGYDKPAEEYLLFDSWYGYSRGEGRRFAMDFIEEGWRQFNHTFIVIYEARREAELMNLLGEYADYLTAAEIARDRALAEVRANPDDAWAWFNLGTAYSMLGNYREAASAYDYWRTLDGNPFRMLWYQFGPYEAYYNLGRYDDVLALALASERTTPYVEEVYYYRGLVYAAQGNANSAVFQFDRALEFNSNFQPAREAKEAVLQGRFSPPDAG